MGNKAEGLHEQLGWLENKYSKIKQMKEKIIAYFLY